MATYDNTYSHVVAWLKIIFLLLTLAILSTLFLVARIIDPVQNVPFANVDIDKLTCDQRISNPNYTVVTANGTAVRLAARRASPDPSRPGRIIGLDVDAGITLNSGTDIAITAQTLVLDQTNRQAGLASNVVITTSDGYRMTTQTLDMTLETTRISSDSKTVVTLEFGTLTSGRFILTGDGSAGHTKFVSQMACGCYTGPKGRRNGCFAIDAGGTGPDRLSGSWIWRTGATAISPWKSPLTN